MPMDTEYYDYGDPAVRGYDYEPAMDPNKGVEHTEVYDAALQKLSRDSTYERAYQALAVVEARSNADIAYHMLKHLELDEHWAYRQMPSKTLSCPAEDSPRTCFSSPQIRSRGQKQHPVQKITFRFVTRDQGPITRPTLTGHVWYTAAVIPGDNTKSDMIAEEDEMTDTPLDHCLDAKPLVRERHVYQNKHYTYDFEVNTVVWSALSTDAEEAVWVKSLSAGDRIVVRAHVKTVGWQAKIRCVSVIIHNALSL